MIIFLLIIGLLTSPVADAQDMKDKSVYEYIHEMTKRARYFSETELAVQNYVTAVYADNPIKHLNLDVDESMIDKAVFRRLTAVCGESKENQLGCIELQAHLESLVYGVSWIRELGRDLQMIAAGYETGIDDYPGHGVNIASRLPSISHMWRATNETFITPIQESSAVGLQYPEENMDEIDKQMEELVGMLKELVRSSNGKDDDAEMIAAVMRYKNGYRHAEYLDQATDEEEAEQNEEEEERDEDGKVDCSEDDEDVESDELMLLKKRWCDIEEHMACIHALVREPYADEELCEGMEGDGEVEKKIPPTENYIIFPTWIDEGSNLYVWVRLDDIGIGWELPMEPVHPLIYFDEEIM